jgi:hypothetical protein
MFEVSHILYIFSPITFYMAFSMNEMVSREFPAHLLAQEETMITQKLHIMPLSEVFDHLSVN